MSKERKVTFVLYFIGSVLVGVSVFSGFMSYISEAHMMTGSIFGTTIAMTGTAVRTTRTRRHRILLIMAMWAVGVLSWMLHVA